MRPVAKSDAVEHPLLRVLLGPLLDLRAALGDGSPPTDVLAALASAADHTAAAESPGRGGRYLLESTGTAPAAVPVAARTEGETAALADHHASLAGLVTAAYATRDTAAGRLDSVIEDFRAKAGPMLAVAQSQSDVDAVIDLASQSTRDGVREVSDARDEMDGHTRRTRALDRGPDAPAVTVPSAFEADPEVQAGLAGTPGAAPGVGGATTAIPAGLDPHQAAQLALQQAALASGVQLGSVALDAGVEIGSKLIDGVVQVATHGIDTGAQLAEQGISTLAAGAEGSPGNGGGAPGSPAAPTAPAGTGDKPGTGTALFGGLGGTPSNPSSAPPKGGNDAGANTPPPPTTVSPLPEQDREPEPAPVVPEPPAAAGPGDQPGTTGAVVPPATRPDAGRDQEEPRTRRPGQAGVVLETS